MKNKNMNFNLPQLQWQTKKPSRRGVSNNSYDVTVNIRQRNDRKCKSANSISVVFRNDLYKLFNSDYVMFAFLKTRMYFQPGDVKTGYKLTPRGKNSNSRVMQASVDDIELAKSFVGNYDLQYDEFYELYYIERK